MCMAMCTPSRRCYGMPETRAAKPWSPAATSVASPDGCLVVHASPEDDERGIGPDTPDEEIQAHAWQGSILCGHTHRPVHRHVPGRQIVNAGSVGWPLDGGPRPSYSVLGVAPVGRAVP